MFLTWIPAFAGIVGGVRIVEVLLLNRPWIIRRFIEIAR